MCGDRHHCHHGNRRLSRHAGLQRIDESQRSARGRLESNLAILILPVSLHPVLGRSPTVNSGTLRSVA
jgi:hypothetical protein